MTTDIDVAVAGELFVDLILSGFDRWPEPGKEVFAKQFRREIGGGTAITACGLAKLGAQTALLGIVGNEWGDWMIDSLQQRNVNTRWVQHDALEPTAFTVTVTMPQERSFTTYNGANRGLEESLKSQIRANAFRGVRHVHLAYAPSIQNAEQIFADLHRHGCAISLDVGWREEWIRYPEVLQLLRLVDVFFPNEVEAQHLTGESHPDKILQAFRSSGVRRVALKLGARGGALLWDGNMQFVSAREVNPVDTTGAGDCFDAGFLYGLLRGFAPDVCLQMANICGALSTLEYGGIAGFPDLATVNDEMRNTRPCAK